MSTIDELVENFEFLQDWDEKYQYLIELGELLPAMAPELRIDTNKVQGCVSDVWVALRSVGSERLLLEADSNTPIIKGVVALLVTLCREKAAQEILETDFDQLFERLSLADHLSPNRHVGIYSIVNKIYAQAQIRLEEAA